MVMSFWERVTLAAFSAASTSQNSGFGEFGWRKRFASMWRFRGSMMVSWKGFGLMTHEIEKEALKYSTNLHFERRR